MKLSELAYQVVKNVKYLDDSGFSYQTFVLQEYDSDQDYANSINNAFEPINEAIHRLSDRNKIAYVTLSLGTRTGGIVDYSSIVSSDHPVKKIKAVFYVDGTEYKNVGYREMGKGKIFIQSTVSAVYYLQYIEDIKHFSRSDFLYNSSEDEEGSVTLTEEADVDMSDYGLNETICSYIIEYAQGKLQEPIAPELANMHLTRAEEYFADLDEQQTWFAQERINRKFSI